MSFSVRQDTFDGPLHLLLELIEKEELPITDVSLAKVTDDYVAYVNAHDVPSEELADFLVIATRLLLIKSRAILPVLVVEEQEDAGKLALQLRMYREFAEATKGLEQLWAAGQVMYARKPVSARAAAVVTFAPPPGVDLASMEKLFRVLLKKLEPFFSLQQHAMERVVSVQERMKHIRSVILERARLTFADVMKGAANKVDVVVSFLALLELMKQRVVNVVQGETFDEIHIRRVD